MIMKFITIISTCVHFTQVDTSPVPSSSDVFPFLFFVPILHSAQSFFPDLFASLCLFPVYFYCARHQIAGPVHIF